MDIVVFLRKGPYSFGRSLITFWPKKNGTLSWISGPFNSFCCDTSICERDLIDAPKLKGCRVV